MKGEPCTVCGHTEMNLVDGFYYCDECGTQDTNVRETIVEQKTIGDGTFAATTRRKLVEVTQKGNEMSGEWYKWHAFNFILMGLADDLVSLGANPSFKKKLLWIWIRYIKMYQNKEELGLVKDQDNSITIENLIEARRTARDSISVSEKTDEEISEKKSKSREEVGHDITHITKGLLMSMLYLALNLDKSDIQLSHLFRYVKEGRISFTNGNKYFPDDFNPKYIPNWDCYNTVIISRPSTLRHITMTLIKKLDLSVPCVPDLRKILKNIIKELCLPNEFYELVCSLMHLCPCNYLTLSRKYIYGMVRVPDYETVVMAYVLVALKMCFGLDDQYEIELSNVVDKYNEENNLERSYKFGISSTTKRLFSFREWCNYLKARKIMLSKHRHMVTDTHILDIDDYVFVEHQAVKEEGKADLTDKIAMEIIEKIPQDNVGVIPKEEFKCSYTPISSYTQVILDYCQDPEFKYLLSEDYTQYSLKYACEDVQLIDSDKSENIIVGVSESNKKLTKRLKSVLDEKNSNLKMVYVKNCDNKNWMKTKPPTMEHVVKVKSNEINGNKNDKDSDHGYDSNLENGTNDNDTPANNDSTDTIEESVDIKLETIDEEEEGKNIFDDNFEDLNCDAGDEPGDESGDKQCEEITESNMNTSNHIIENHNITFEALGYEFEDDQHSNASDNSNDDLSGFNPDTFDRAKAIKDLVIAACKKHKIPIPKHFKDPKDRVKTRKRKKWEDIPGMPRKKKICIPGQARKEVDELLNAYHEHLGRDVLHQVSEQVRTVIQNMTNTEENNTENNLEHIQYSTNEGMNHDESNINKNIVETVNKEQQNPNTDNAEKENGVAENEASVAGEDEESDEEEPDWRTEGDPKYDEKKYDVNQLYVKVEEPSVSECFAVKDDPVIEEIIQRKLKEVHKNPRKFMKLCKLKRIKLNECLSSDSDDDVPLSDLQKERKFIEEMRRIDKSANKPLIKNNVPVFKYWLRHYGIGNRFIKSIEIHVKFEQELRDNFPKSFYFVLHECASVLNITSFHMYKHLHSLEKMIAGRANFGDFGDL